MSGTTGGDRTKQDRQSGRITKIALWITLLNVLVTSANTWATIVNNWATMDNTKATIKNTQTGGRASHRRPAKQRRLKK